MALLTVKIIAVPIFIQKQSKPSLKSVHKILCKIGFNIACSIKMIVLKNNVLK